MVVARALKLHVCEFKVHAIDFIEKVFATVNLTEATEAPKYCPRVRFENYANRSSVGLGLLYK